MASSGAGPAAAPPGPPAQEEVDAATADLCERLRTRVLDRVSCKETERLLDGNFKINDEMCATMCQAWDCAVRLDSQLGAADRPWEDRNRWMQSLEAECREMEQKKHDLEEGILCMKLEVQTALATSQPMLIDRVVEVLGANLQFRRRCQLLGQSLEYAISSARMVLRSLGERPDIAPLDAKGGGVAKRWRVEFDEMRQTNHAMIGALRHPDATMALPGTALEEQIDHNWRFILDLVGLFERVGEASAALAAGAERARELLEAQLPALLECKLAIQQCAAVGAGVPDAELVGRSLASAQAAQAEAREFLTSNEVDVSDIVPTKFVEEMLPHPAAFQKYKSPEAVGGDHYLPVLRLLTYNIFIRAPAPQFTHNTDDDRKDERLSRFVEHLSRYDVVCLQEAFGSFSHRIDWLVGAAREQGFHEFHRSTTNVWPRYFIDGGLMIMSRLPIVARSATTFEPGTYIDRLTAKGALHAKVRCGTAGPFLHVCTTHLQSTYNEETFRQSSRVRRSQIGQLVHFLRQVTNDDDSSEGGANEERGGGGPSVDAGGGGGGGRRWPLVVCGTLNFNGRQSAMSGAHSAEYLEFLEIFRQGLGDVRDLLYDVSGSHPVTYADTRLTVNGEVPVERVLTNSSVYEKDSLKRQRLDYLFYFPPREAASEPMVPATCQVEKFLVDRTKDVGAPVTQLSDHYGIEATLAVLGSGHPAAGAAPPPGAAGGAGAGTLGGGAEGLAAAVAAPAGGGGAEEADGAADPGAADDGAPEPMAAGSAAAAAGAPAPEGAAGEAGAEGAGAEEAAAAACPLPAGSAAAAPEPAPGLPGGLGAT